MKKKKRKDREGRDDEQRDVSICNNTTKEIVWLQIVRGNEISAATTAAPVAQLLAEVKLFFNQFCVRIFAKKTCPFTLTRAHTPVKNLYQKGKHTQNTE